MTLLLAGQVVLAGTFLLASFAAGWILRGYEWTSEEDDIYQ